MYNTYICIIAISCLGASLHAVTTLYASALDCASTLPLTDPTGTVLILDQDLTISSSCPLVLTGNAGNLTITAAGSQRLIIASGTPWNISALAAPHTLIFAGTAQCVMLPGSQLLANQSTPLFLLFQDNAQWVVQP